MAYNLLVVNEAPSKSKERFESVMIVVLPLAAIAIATLRTGSLGFGIWLSLFPVFKIALAMIVSTWMIKNQLYSRIAYIAYSAYVLLDLYFSIQEPSG